MTTILDVMRTSKQVGEKRVLTFVFSSELAITSTVESISNVTITPFDRVTQVLALTEDQRGVSGQTARVRFSGGTTGEKYLVTCDVLCSDGQQLFGQCVIDVQNVTVS